MEFCEFESFLCSGDAVNQLAFKMFDLDNVGKVSYGESLEEAGEVSITNDVICNAHTHNCTLIINLYINLYSSHCSISNWNHNYIKLNR